MSQAFAPAGEGKTGGNVSRGRRCGQAEFQAWWQGTRAHGRLGVYLRQWFQRHGLPGIPGGGASPTSLAWESLLAGCNTVGWQPWAGFIGGHGFSIRAPAGVFTVETELPVQAPRGTSERGPREQGGGERCRVPGPSMRAGFNPGFFVHRGRESSQSRPATTALACRQNVPPPLASLTKTATGPSADSLGCLSCLAQPWGTWGPWPPWPSWVQSVVEVGGGMPTPPPSQLRPRGIQRFPVSSLITPGFHMKYLFGLALQFLIVDRCKHFSDEKEQ